MAMAIISPRRVRKYCLPLACIIIFLVIFVDFDLEQNIQKHTVLPKKRDRRIKEEWNRREDTVPAFYERSRLPWSDPSAIPQTVIHRHVPGWTLYDNIYAFKGTFYIVTNSTEHIPSIRMMISSGKPVRDEPHDDLRREPTSRNMQVIDPVRAEKEFGSFTKRVEGATFVVSEAPQYLSNSYNFLAEILFGLWRTYTSLDLEIAPDGTTGLEAPQRIILPNIIDFLWRDKALISPRVLHMAFPSAHIQTAEDWQDFTDLEMPHLYDRVVLADRAAAMRVPDFEIDHHFASNTASFVGSPHWWLPIRNIFHELAGTTITTKDLASRVPVITYISQQGLGIKSLTPEDHDGLVRELSRLEGTYGYEIHVYRSEDLTLEDQITVAARSTILIGLHSQVLLPLLWMLPTKRSAIIELFRDLDTTQNYAWNAVTLGIQAHAFYGTRTPYQYPDRPKSLSVSPGEHLKADGGAVAALCIDILNRS